MELFRSPVAVSCEVKESMRRRTAVIPASGGAGASFVCGQLASCAYHKVNVIEAGKPHFMLALDLEKRAGKEGIYFYEDDAGSCSWLSASNEYLKINWLVRRPCSEKIKQEILQKIVMYPPDGISFYDFSGCCRESIIPVLGMMDEIYIVIDPLPSKLIESAEFIEEIKLRFPSAVFIINKMNRGVYRTELKRFLGNSSFREIPFVSPEKIYRAEYNCTLLGTGITNTK